MEGRAHGPWSFATSASSGDPELPGYIGAEFFRRERKTGQGWLLLNSGPSRGVKDGTVPGVVGGQDGG